MMRSLLVVGLLCWSLAASHAADSEAAAAIKRTLSAAKSWTMYIEYTDAGTPSDRAQKLIWEYFERDGKLMARQLGLVFGGCDTEVSTRDNGFSFPWCPPYNGVPSLDYDPADTRYPFKSRNPRKIWLERNE